MDGIKMNVLGANQVIGAFYECFAFGEKSGSAVDDYCIHILFAMLFNFRRAIPLGHRGYI
jgi:hypothetical protein